MYKPAWKQEYIISVDYSLLRLFTESEDTLDEFLHRIIVLLWIDNRSVLARTGILSSLLLLVLLSASLALAGPGRWGARGSGGWGMGTPYQDLYKPAHQETVAGEVVGIEKTTPMKQMNQGLALSTS